MSWIELVQGMKEGTHGSQQYVGKKQSQQRRGTRGRHRMPQSSEGSSRQGSPRSRRGVAGLNPCSLFTEWWASIRM